MKPKLRLTGEDGNAFLILGRAMKALERSGAGPEEIARFLKEAKSSNYDHLIQTVMKWCDVS
jgi:hypothetical protein